MARTPNSTEQQSTGGKESPNPVWFKPVMFGFMLVGLLWIIIFYLTNGEWPVPALSNWNIMVGFGIALIGFIMTTRWR